MSINDKEYVVICGFSMLGNNVQFDMTMQYDDTEPVVISFGENVMTKSVFEELYSDMLETNLDKIDENEAITMTYARQSSRAAFFPIQKPADDSISVFEIVSLKGAYHWLNELTQYQKIYFDDDTNRLAVNVLAYSNNVNHLYESFSTPVTTVSSYTIEIQRDSTSVNSKLNGIDAFEFDTSDFNKDNTLLRALFEDILGLLEVDWNVISEVLDGITGKITVSHNEGNYVSVAISGIGLTEAMDETGLPIVFHMEKMKENGSESISNYTVSSSIRYNTVYYQPGSEVYNFVYFDANEIVSQISVDIN